MTGLIPEKQPSPHEKEFSRKSFVKGGGALIVGLTLTGSAQAFNDPKAASPSHTGALMGPPDPLQVDSWIAIHADNTASIYSGRVNLGQGTPNGLLMIAGEELDLSMSQLKWIEADSNVTPDSGVTVGSSSIRSAGPQVRAAAASAKQALLGLAAAQLGVSAANLTAKNGVVSGGGRTVTYGALIGDKLLSTKLVAATLNPGQGVAKPIAQYSLVGTSPPRIDIPDKVTGKFTYVQNVRVPGMLHARVVRPRGQANYGQTPTVISIDPSSIQQLAEVQILRKGNFIAVVSPHEYTAIQAAAQLKVKWDDTAKLPGSGNMVAAMRKTQTADAINAQTGNIASGLGSAAKVVTASYSWAFNMHGPIGPSAAVASVTPTSAFVMCNTQGVYRLRGTLASLLGMPESSIRVQYVEGSSAFGHCTSDDAAQAAALTSQLAGKPVRLQFMRWDDHGFDCYGPAEIDDVRGGIDASGKIVGIDFTATLQGLTNSNNAFETTYEMAGFGPIPSSIGATSTAITNGAQYVIPNRRVTSHSVPIGASPVLKTAQLRAPGDIQATFAFEQMVDELAYAANMDPVQFRLNQMNDPRWTSILQQTAQAASWQTRVSASSLSKGNVVTGRGVALAPRSGSLSAVIAEIEVNKKTGKIVAKHMWASQDAGLTIFVNGSENQMQGGVIQSVSRALHEEVVFTTTRVTSLDWATYPILRFKDHPSVTPVVVQRTDQVPGGGGEPPAVPTPAALANAFFDATGVRMRQAPMTAGRVRAALKAAGAA